MEIVVKNDYESLSYSVAEMIAKYINKNPEALLCLAGGNTPLRTYEILIEMQKEGKVNLNSANYVGLDEWVGLGYKDKGSCKQMMYDTFYLPAKIDESRICFFDGLEKDMKKEKAKIEGFINSKGKIGLSLLGIGMNGHIGFNEPNGPSDEGALIIPLDKTTQTVGQKYFEKSYPLEYGITLGYSTLGKSDVVIYMANGEKKHDIVERIIDGDVSKEIPASLLKNHENLFIFIDDAVVYKK